MADKPAFTQPKMYSQIRSRELPGDIYLQNLIETKIVQESLPNWKQEEFEKLVAAGKLDRQHVEALVLLTQSGFCLHRSWGFGRIKSVDTVFARFTIDFQTKAGHTMDLGFAAESLKPIDPNHVLARKLSDLEGLRQMAALNHLDLIKLVLQSYAGKATIDQIQQVLDTH